MTKEYDVNCRRCPRLAKHLDQVRADYPDYHARPVAPFGDPRPAVFIVGLAPGMHGANASGRPFTGDYAGILLYRTLFEQGFSNQPESLAIDDGLRLRGCRISNAVKCLPPENKPTGAEIRNCNAFLAAEMSELAEKVVVLALGRIAHEAVLRALRLKAKDFPFAHGACHQLPGGRRLVDSYHCSRYNTQTKRLTEQMFRDVVVKARELVGT